MNQNTGSSLRRRYPSSDRRNRTPRRVRLAVYRRRESEEEKEKGRKRGNLKRLYQDGGVTGGGWGGGGCLRDRDREAEICSFSARPGIIREGRSLRADSRDKFQEKYALPFPLSAPTPLVSARPAFVPPNADEKNI